MDSECDEEVLLEEPIHLLVNTTNALPFQFLFSSRPEAHIQQILSHSSSIPHHSYFLSLRDFSSLEDVRTYLRRRLSEVRQKESQIMADVPRPWPTQSPRVYSFTMYRHLSSLSLTSMDKLQAALAIHRGLDPLYDQVLSEARERVVGTIIYLGAPLRVSMGGLG
jgi:hypothetical protein